MRNKGYFGIGIINPKSKTNVGSLWRSANILGASFIFTIGKRIPNIKVGSNTEQYIDELSDYTNIKNKKIVAFYPNL